MESAEFWEHVTSFNPEGTSETSGWYGLRNMIHSQVRKWYPTVRYFDWEYIEHHALLGAMRDFDPERSSIGTWICTCARGAAKSWIRKSKRETHLSLSQPGPYEDVTLEDGIGCTDLYSTVAPDKLNLVKQILGVDVNVMAELGVTSRHTSLLGYTVANLIDDLCDGVTEYEIGNKIGVSYKTVSRMTERVRERLREFGLCNELMDRVSERNKQVRPLAF